MGLARDVKTVDEASKHAGIILDCINYSIKSQEEYNNLKTLYEELNQKAIELGEKCKWIDLPPDFSEAKYHLDFVFSRQNSLTQKS